MTKSIYALFVILLLCLYVPVFGQNNVGVGTITPHASAALDVTSNTKGFLPPRLTKAERDAIATPADGLVVSCTDCNIKGLHQYVNGSWQAMMSGSTGN